MKTLLIQGDLLLALKQEKELKELGLNILGIAPDYMAAMLLLKSEKPSVTICSYELSLGNPLMNIADYFKAKCSNCKIVICGNIAKKSEIIAAGYYFLNSAFDKKEVNLLLENINDTTIVE